MGAANANQLQQFNTELFAPAKKARKGKKRPKERRINGRKHGQL